jgi:hypothetical protein
MTPTIYQSLRVSQNQSQTNKMDSGGSLEVRNVIICILHKNSWKWSFEVEDIIISIAPNLSESLRVYDALLVCI